MKRRPNDALERASTWPCPPWPRSVWKHSRLALVALAFGGCATTHHQPEQTASEATAGSPNASNVASSDHTTMVDPKNQFTDKATDRQKFQVHIDFGRVFESQGNIEAAINEYQDALGVVQTTKRGTLRAADEALAHRRIGGSMDRLGRFAQAETHYKKALGLNPKDPKIWNDAGYSYYLQGRWADAEQALKSAARLAPDDERIRTNLGLTLAAAGRTDDALALLSRSNGNAIGHANLGFSLAASGQLEQARRQYEMALSLRPDMDVARRALARLDVQQKSSQSVDKSNALASTDARAIAQPSEPGVSQTSTAQARIAPPVPANAISAVKPVAVAITQQVSAPSMGSAVTAFPPAYFDPSVSRASTVQVKIPPPRLASPPPTLSATGAAPKLPDPAPTSLSARSAAFPPTYFDPGVSRAPTTQSKIPPPRSSSTVPPPRNVGAASNPPVAAPPKLSVRTTLRPALFDPSVNRASATRPAKIPPPRAASYVPAPTAAGAAKTQPVAANSKVPARATLPPARLDPDVIKASRATLKIPPPRRGSSVPTPADAGMANK
jgi:Flp pilus assembly protein TadD